MLLLNHNQTQPDQSGYFEPSDLVTHAIRKPDLYFVFHCVTWKMADSQPHTLANPAVIGQKSLWLTVFA